MEHTTNHWLKTLTSIVRSPIHGRREEDGHDGDQDADVLTAPELHSDVFCTTMQNVSGYCTCGFFGTNSWDRWEDSPRFRWRVYQTGHKEIMPMDDRSTAQLQRLVDALLDRPGASDPTLSGIAVTTRLVPKRSL